MDRNHGVSQRIENMKKILQMIALFCIPLSAEAGLWDPSDVTGGVVVAWFDAAQSSSVTTNTSGVALWTDRSGNGNHAFQTTPAAQPAYDKANSEIHFDGSADGLAVTNDPFKGLQTFTVLFVGRWDVYASGSYRNAMIGWCDETNPKGSWQVLCGYADNLNFRRRGVSPEDMISSPRPQALTNDFIAGGFRYGSGTFTSQVRFNGEATQTAAESGGTQIPYGSETNRSALGIAYNGDNWTSPATPYDGVLKEVVVVKDVSLDTVLKTEGYLAWKWGLEDKLASGHPYKDAAPTIPDKGTVISIR